MGHQRATQLHFAPRCMCLQADVRGQADRGRSTDSLKQRMCVRRAVKGPLMVEASHIAAPSRGIQSDCLTYISDLCTRGPLQYCCTAHLISIWSWS